MRTTTMPLASVALLAVLIAACTDAPTMLPSADAAGTSEVRMGTDPPGPMRQIEALKRAWDAAWGDAAAFAALYTEDAEFIDPIANIYSGREEIRALHAFLFSGPFAGTSQTSELRRVVFLTGTTALVRLDVALTGFSVLPPGLPETEPGVVRTVVQWVVVKHRGEWLILSQHMTLVPPAF
jgi:uncharacterized protein (TIGR02246 family)